MNVLTFRKKTHLWKNLNITENTVNMSRLLQVLFHPPQGIKAWMYKENKIHSGNVSEAFCLPDFVDLVIFRFYTIGSWHRVFYFENWPDALCRSCVSDCLLAWLADGHLLSTSSHSRFPAVVSILSVQRAEARMVLKDIRNNILTSRNVISRYLQLWLY